MHLNDQTMRNRAALALQYLVGQPGKSRIIHGGIPVAIEIADARLIVVAGDNERPLDPYALAPLARTTGCDVMGIWVDPYLSGHRFLIDAVVTSDGETTTYLEHRFWLAEKGAAWLVSEHGPGPAIGIGSSVLQVRKRSPFRTEAERVIGTARGQARLQKLILAGSPYATPISRYVGR